MQKDIFELLVISGTALYAANYLIGWGLYYKKISMSKRTHRLIYTSLILNLVLIIFNMLFFTDEFFLCSLSLLFLLALPLGKKGSIYHRIISTAGISVYAIFAVGHFT